MTDPDADVRLITSDELSRFNDLVSYVFAADREHHDQAARSLQAERPWIRPEWVLASVVDGQLVSTLGAYPWEVRVNGRGVPAAGVTTVGTDPGFRRQGHQRRVMTRALEWHHEQGQAVAMLWASFGAIYQRYGYGLASLHTGYTFDPSRAELREMFDPGCRVALADWSTPDVRETVQQIYREYIGPRTLTVDRPEWWWANHWADEYEQKPAKRMHLAVASDASGRPRGYFSFTTGEHERSFEPSPNQVMETGDFVALDLDAWVAMWQFIRGHDLVREVQFGFAAEDDPAVDLLLEPRALRRRTGDGIWLRMVEVPAALEARGYEPDAEGSVILGVRDELCGWNEGAYRVTVEGGRASVVRTAATPEVTMPVSALSSMYSGLRSATSLARVRRAEGDTAALRAADRMFATAYRPHVMNGF